MKPAQRVAAALLFGTILQGAALGQNLVYDNTANLRTNVIYRFSKEYGDEVALAPGYRTVSQFAFQYFGDFNPTNRLDATAKVRFDANDGPDADPGPKVITMPGAAPLWESDSFPLLTGYNIVSLDVDAHFGMHRKTKLVFKLISIRVSYNEKLINGSITGYHKRQ